MKNYFVLLLKSVMAGVAIGLGGCVFYALVAAGNRTLGAIMFSFALATIIGRGYSLYTGKSGYVVHKDKEKVFGFLVDLLITILGNLIGCIFMAILFNLTNLTNLLSVARDISAAKQSIDYFEFFARSIFCGFLMYIAADCYKKLNGEFLKLFVLIVAVSIFVISGFEHSIANMFFFAAALSFGSKFAIYTVIGLVGNAVGSNILAGMDRVISGKDK